MRIDFYILNAGDEQAQAVVACRLAAKAYYANHQVYLHCRDAGHANVLDNLLWTFKEDSFIPHNLADEPIMPAPMVQMGHTTLPLHQQDIMINLATDIPSNHNQFRRIIEIVPANETAKALCREHYLFYKQAGYDLVTHELAIA